MRGLGALSPLLHQDHLDVFGVGQILDPLDVHKLQKLLDVAVLLLRE